MQSGDTSPPPPPPPPPPPIWNITPELYKAAVEGNIEPFKEIIRRRRQQLSLVVTPIKNTILHINIASENVSIKLVEQAVEICPSLALQVNGDGETPLHFAAEFSLPDVVEALIKLVKAQHGDLESGVGAARQMLRTVDSKRNTALHRAMRKKCSEVVRILLKEDPDFSYSANDCGETPLYVAAGTGFYSGVQLMFEICSSVNHQGPDGKTALHAAVRIRNTDITRAILERQRSLIKERDEYGWTPLHYAGYFGGLSIVSILLESDAVSTPYAADNYRKMTALHLAAGQGHVDIVRQIISHCPDCYKMVDKKGWNVLHFAMASLSLQPNELTSLLSHRLLKNLIVEKNDEGNTPLHVYAILEPIGFNLIQKVVGHLEPFNNWNFNVYDTYRYGCPDLKRDILQQSNKFGPYSRGVICIQEKLHEGYFQKVDKAKDARLVVAALIATVTFAAGFTVPGGYKSEQGKEQGTAILSKNLAFQFFVTANAMALVFSMSAVFIYFIMSAYRFQKMYYRNLFKYAPWITVLAMGAMVIAFITGSYAVLTPSLGLAIATCLIGLSVFVLLFRVCYCLFKGY